MNNKEDNVEQLTKDILELKKQTASKIIKMSKKIAEIKKDFSKQEFYKYVNNNLGIPNAYADILINMAKKSFFKNESKRRTREIIFSSK